MQDKAVQAENLTRVLERRIRRGYIHHEKLKCIKSVLDSDLNSYDKITQARILIENTIKECM
jgi:hypothetical protein